MKMSHSFDVSWAQHFGIDLAELATEHPCHPIQISNHRRITAQAAKYWERERFLARLEYSSGAISVETPETPVVKTPVKRAKVRKYEFTEQQLEIALRSLDAGGAV
jgi:hypothetical protein